MLVGSVGYNNKGKLFQFQLSSTNVMEISIIFSFRHSINETLITLQARKGTFNWLGNLLTWSNSTNLNFPLDENPKQPPNSTLLNDELISLETKELHFVCN